VAGELTVKGRPTGMPLHSFWQIARGAATLYKRVAMLTRRLLSVATQSEKLFTRLLQ
jgi:hypothetical protein